MDFTKLRDYVDYLPTSNVPGCDLAVYRDHQLLFRHQAGFRDDEKKQPMAGNETFFLYSCSKVFTTCAVMQLIERGKLRLDDPVGAYLPAFSHMNVKDGDTVRPAKTVMTIRHLMSMQGGLNYDMDSPAVKAAMEKYGNRATTRQLIDAKAQDPLEFDPGDNFLYSLCHDVLGAVVEAVSGLRFSDYLKENIYVPLGLKTMTFHPSEDVLARMCALYEYDPQRYCLVLRTKDEIADRLDSEYESGGGGLVGDVEDYIAFADALACGGSTKDGHSLLSPETIQLWSANQLCPRGRKSFDGWKRVGYSYALGVRTRVSDRIGGAGPVGEFGWDGAAGSWVMIDPKNHLSAFFGMHVKNYGYNYDVIHPTLRNLIYEGLEQ